MTRARAVLTLAAAGAAMLTTATGASAAVDPGAFATARDGQLLVSSSVLVTGKGAEMMGGWVNEGQSCLLDRKLTVRILIDRVRGGNTQRHTDRMTGMVENCGEGGPNFGFQLRASDVGMACPDGTWRPGQYTYATNTLHHARGLRAIADLFFKEKDTC
jgi:hypothetical protein